MPAIKPVYALVGSDPYLQFEALQAVLKEAGPVQRRDFDGEDVELHEVLDEVRSFSMFGPSKLVVVRDADELLGRYREGLEKYVLSLGENPGSAAGVLVLRLLSLPANQKIHRAIGKVGEVRKCEPPSLGELPGWIMSRGKQVHRVEVEHAAAVALADLIGADLGRLDAELGKLAIHVTPESGEDKGRLKITAADVATTVPFQREQEIKDIIAMLARGRTEEAIRRWRQLTAADSKAEYRIITWLGMWLERCRVCLDLTAKNAGSQQLGNALWIRDPVELKEFVATVNRLGRDGVADRLAELTDLDHRIKSGLADATLGVERFMSTALVR